MKHEIVVGVKNQMLDGAFYSLRNLWEVRSKVLIVVIKLVSSEGMYVNENVQWKKRTTSLWNCADPPYSTLITFALWLPARETPLW